MNNLEYIGVFVLIFLKTINDADCGCSLDLNKDFGTPPPVYIRNGAYLEPDQTGRVTLQESETILVGCPGQRNHIVFGNDGGTNAPNYDVVEARCIRNTNFSMDRWIGEFRDVKCKSQPWFTSEATDEKCYGGNKIYKFGYKLKNVLYTLYEGCFDKNLYTTYYVKHNLTPVSNFMQKGQPRPSFIEGDLFNKIRMSKVYKHENQRKRIDETLGANMSQKFITKNEFLSRGHLAARADYIMYAQQRATFHYGNTAPQWQRGNAGDWAALEDALRRRIQKYGKTVVLYTGTHRVFTLPDNKGHQREIYLSVDANNNGVVPVPMYFYKVVYDQQNKSALAFVSINSSHYNKTMIEELTFCNDICDGDAKYSWLKWRSNDGTHSFCCKYKEFSEHVRNLPSLEVTKDFY